MVEKKKTEDRYEVKEVPTQIAKVVVDKETGETLDDELLLHILNKLDKIEKSVC
jgi:hypothetical protein|tara:strand:- start:2233 stop:2394 length:162 start_codon:yes stop_codon:yes gene_type:complete